MLDMLSGGDSSAAAQLVETEKAALESVVVVSANPSDQKDESQDQNAAPVSYSKTELPGDKLADFLFQSECWKHESERMAKVCAVYIITKQ
jgi:hypothetical protein